MAIRYQWIKFADDAPFIQSTEYRPNEWVLAEIDDDWPEGGIRLFGVEYCMGQQHVSKWGEIVSRPD